MSDFMDSVQPEGGTTKYHVVGADHYPGVDLTAKFADEIMGYSDEWAWMSARAKAGNFDGIHVNDYIPVLTSNNISLKARVAGLDPYYRYSDRDTGHHIDFICEELWPTLRPIHPGFNYNNGLIPVENLTGDGAKTAFELTKKMDAVAKVTVGGAEQTSGWHYDYDTCTLTFDTAPSGAIVVTGTGSKSPWLSSDLYLYLNSKKGQVLAGNSLNPPVNRVDYTEDGVLHFLPSKLVSKIIEKRFLAPTRYSATGLTSNDNGWEWMDIGKLWLPTEFEVYGSGMWGGATGYPVGGSIQYPIFMGNMRRVKLRNGGRYDWWLLSPYSGNASHWCYVYSSGFANAYNTSDTWVAAPVCFRIG